MNAHAAAGLATQMTSALCSGGKFTTFSGDTDGSAMGKYLAGVYREVFTGIVKADKDADSGQLEAGFSDPS